jgi:hypothetical protein
MIPIYGNNFRLLSDRLLKAALQRPILDVKACNIGFDSPCYTEAMKFYTEPDTIGSAAYFGAFDATMEKGRWV